VLDNTIYASSGTNVMNGFSGSDTVSYFNATAGVTIDLGVTTSQNTGGSGADTLLDFENLTGSTFADSLTGSAGDNIINGAAGNDLIIGGAGSDELTGGAGADTFRYLVAEDSGAAEALRDLIVDFAAEDVIDLSAIDANTAVDGDQGFTFIGSADFSSTDASGQLRYDAVLGVIYGSVDADADAEFSIALQGMPAVTADDFML
jgi:Ca2+-binding RTX toxin-like protein